MTISVMTIEAKDRNASEERQALEIAERLNVWFRDRPSARVINIETLFVRNSNFNAPYDGEKMMQLVRVWYEIADIGDSAG
ncbi:hypothetical protein Rfer_4421 (plasmid) [Rhodoferax ferrireducens T118]|uniref:Uncharacterized protein n=1 Tax=Albidiferax ferrireducens (strain ATCC BAA-621 / DSM 15236 / T118) TaxID=338969 RepID=Q21Q38_ALBFT|nr:hypothetical protein [Rhodoferax ferrireducens]ABD72107.1 hypothetical protein Rfer_4421 [Rhodoferax ferrireducens T118]